MMILNYLLSMNRKFYHFVMSFLNTDYCVTFICIQANCLHIFFFINCHMLQILNFRNKLPFCFWNASSKRKGLNFSKLFRNKTSQGPVFHIYIYWYHMPQSWLIIRHKHVDGHTDNNNYKRSRRCLKTLKTNVFDIFNSKNSLERSLKKKFIKFWYKQKQRILLLSIHLYTDSI